jgi:carbamate kinase
MNAQTTAEQIVELASRGYRIVITHGNGPQVGSQLLRSEAGSSHTYELPLDVCVATTQGEIGYILQMAIQSHLRRRGIAIPVAGLITQVVVDKHDPAFLNPTKPIGPFYSAEVAERKRRELEWNIIEDAARGYRRVVPSPQPLEIIEIDVIRECLEKRFIVIATGGGGIPVAFSDGDIIGIEAVIDKDKASALLANRLGVEKFIISTDVEVVYLNYKKSNQRPMQNTGIDEARSFLTQGHFLEGSMKPKIEAAIDFLEGGGEEVIITDPDHIISGLDGKTGTHIHGRGKS